VVRRRSARWRDAGPLEQALFEALDTRLRALTEHHEAMEFRRAAAETRAIWAARNQYLQRAAPWSAISTDARAAARSLRTALNLACLAARISAPFCRTPRKRSSTPSE
jgi:methionyl-tRNA synthetase